jgi:hypothetical protein
MPAAFSDMDYVSNEYATYFPCVEVCHESHHWFGAWLTA